MKYMFGKKWRVVRTDSRVFPWKIEERYTLLFFIHWWSTPNFAPPHRFERMDDAVNRVFEVVGNQIGADGIEIVQNIIRKD